MKNSISNKIIAIVLSLSMALSIIPSFSVPFFAEGEIDYGANIGAVAEWDTTSVLLAAAPSGESGSDVVNGISPAQLPSKISITDYYNDGANIWYKLDAAPGYEWPESYANYHWTYAYSIVIISENGETLIFDENGNEILVLTLPKYEKIALTADSSLQGGVSYQWQICYDVANNLWVDIYGEDSATVNLSYGIVATLLDTNNSVKIRCESYSGSKTATSSVVYVTVDETVIDDGDDTENEEPEIPVEPTIDIQMNGTSVSVIKMAYEDYSFTAPLSSVVTGLDGALTYTWKFIKVDGSEVLIDETTSELTLDYSAINNNSQYYDSTKYLVYLSVTATNGTDSVSNLIEIHNLSVTVKDYITTEDGDYIDVIVAGDVPEDTTLDLTQTKSSVTLPENEEILIALDITLRDSVGNEWQPETGESVTVTLLATQLGLEDGDYFVVYHVHNGETQKLGPYLVQDGKVTFEVVGFSEFVFAVVNLDYSSSVGMNAVFNTADMNYFPYSINKPEYGWEDSVTQIGFEEISDDLKMTVLDYYVLEAYYLSVWYQVSITSGTISDFTDETFWVFQNYIGDDAYSSDSLILSEYVTEPESPACDIKVNGESVSEISVSTSEKVTLTAESNIEGSTVTYQWQLYIPVANIWVNISGETSTQCTVNYGMVAGRFDSDGKAYIRCVTTVDSQEIISDSVSITVPSTEATVYDFENVTYYYFDASINALVHYAANIMPVEETGSGTIYNVVINYVFADGSQAANPWTATIESGGDFSGKISSPNVLGYKPDKSDIELNIVDISANHTYTVTYTADLVNFVVVHSLQNVSDENYIVDKRVRHEGYTDSYVGSGLAESYDGFYSLPYDVEQKIAADGSTEVVIQYDRYYYLMTFDLGGGYGVEPIYARVGTPISVGTPIRSGYAFDGWNPELPNTMPAEDIEITAIWTPGNTTYTVVYWAENANDNNYSFWDYEVVGAVSGTTVSGSDGYSGTKTGFHYDHADINVTVKGDGSTVVNVYYKRNTYTLTFAYDGGPLICSLHVHTSSCYNITCTKTEHEHTDSCCEHGGLIPFIHWSHSDSCCNLNLSEHTHSSGCYSGEAICGQTGVSNHNHRVENGCYGVRFEGIKYGQDTSYWWNQAPAGYRWTNSDSGEGYTYAPDMPNEDLLVIGEKLSNSYLYTIHYYEEGTTNKIKDDNQYYRSSDGYYLTSTDYIAIPGFTCLASGYTYPDDNLVYTIYYRRNSYTLTFKNGNETTEKGSFLYQTDISAQYFVPTYNGDDPEGYEFGGWYTTEACIPGTEWNHSGATMPYNNLILYAKWVPVTHDVKLYITKEDWENGEQYLTTITVSHNTTAQEPARPSNGSYNFVGWFYMEDGVEKAFDFDIPVRKDLNLYGKWVADELAPYTIKYAIKDTSTSDPDDLIYIADDTKGSALAGQDKTFEAKAGDELYEGYRVGYYPETNSHSMNILLDADNTYTFIYVPKDEVKYTVKYLEVGTEKVLEAQKDEVTRESVHTENFVYVEGYRPDAYQKRIVLSANESENVIIFWYEIDTEHAPVLVKHYLQNIDGDGYNKDNPYLTTTDLDGVIGNTYTVDIITNITGFNFAKAEASADTEPQEITVGNASVSAVVTAQGLLIELYYDRINYPYEFQFLEQGTNAELVDPVSGTARYGSQVTQTAIDIQGYKVNVSAQDMIIQVEDGTDAVNNVRIFYYVEETVDISYVAVGPEGATDFGSVSPESEPNIPVLSGSVSGSVASPEAAYKFVGWYSNAGCTKEVDSAWISGNKLTPQKNSSGMYESATYYAKFDYNLTSLTIEKQGHQAIDENQTFIFNISGVDVNLDVTVHGNSSVSVYGLTVGADYKITEKSSWSWRYEPVKWSFSTDAATNGETESSGEGNTADIKLGVSGNKLIFENERPTERSYWLDGDSWCDNLFN